MFGCDCMAWCDRKSGKGYIANVGGGGGVIPHGIYCTGSRHLGGYSVSAHECFIGILGGVVSCVVIRSNIVA